VNLSESVLPNSESGHIFECMVAFTAVRTTGIYCRPGCSARPLAQNTRLFDIAAAAEAEGFRPCLRCRPYRAAAPAFMSGPDIVCRGVSMILDGYLDTATEGAMAEQLGASSRHLRRLFREHLGVTPNELAKSSRAHFARRLLDDTDFTVTEIAFAAGFGSVRQMNRVFKEIFRSTPTELRSKRRRADRLVADGGLPLRLPFDGPFDWYMMIRFLRQWAIPGVEHVTDDWYRRTVMIDGHPGVLEVRPLDQQHLIVVAHLPHWEGLIHIARRASSIFGLTSPTGPAREHLGTDPILGPLVDEFPGVRVPGAWDPFEIAIVAIIGQEKSPVETRLTTGRLVRNHGESVSGLTELGLTHVFPDPEALMGATLAELGVSERTRRSIGALSTAVASGELSLDPSQDVDDLISGLSGMPGIEEATVQNILWRLGFRDAFPVPNNELKTRLQMFSGGSRHVVESAENWRPWRSLAASYLLATDNMSEAKSA